MGVLSSGPDTYMALLEAEAAVWAFAVAQDAPGLFDSDPVRVWSALMACVDQAGGAQMSPHPSGDVVLKTAVALHPRLVSACQNQEVSLELQRRAVEQLLRRRRGPLDDLLMLIPRPAGPWGELPPEMEGLEGYALRCDGSSKWREGLLSVLREYVPEALPLYVLEELPALVAMPGVQSSAAEVVYAAYLQEVSHVVDEVVAWWQEQESALLGGESPVLVVDGAWRLSKEWDGFRVSFGSPVLVAPYAVACYAQEVQHALVLPLRKSLSKEELAVCDTLARDAVSQGLIPDPEDLVRMAVALG